MNVESVEIGKTWRDRQHQLPDAPIPSNTDGFDARVDQVINSKQQVYARLNTAADCGYAYHAVSVVRPHSTWSTPALQCFPWIALGVLGLSVIDGIVTARFSPVLVGRIAAYMTNQ
jgi:hypothetical protein